MATQSGLGDREVISQDDPTSFIQVPMFETIVAIHKARNSGVASGGRGSEAEAGDRDAGTLMPRRFLKSGRPGQDRR
ncbi:hypothetical protein D3C72_2122610 [compost metagenome]